MRWLPFKKYRQRSAVLPDGTLPVKSGTELLAPHHLMIQRIRRAIGVPDKHWELYYQSSFDAYACFVQQFPASEAHHHTHPGGMLEHTLEVVEKALALRQGKLLPTGAEAEELARTQAIWTFATTTAALFHDVGKPAVDLSISLYDSGGYKRGLWSPWIDPGFSQAVWYQVNYVRDRQYPLHEQISLLLVSKILPNHCLEWLSGDLGVLNAWSATLLGDIKNAGVLGEMVHQADRLSVARNLSGTQNRVQLSTARQIPLVERLVTGLRYLLDQKQLPLNADGAAGWLVGDDLWLVVKRTLDDLKSHLAREGQSGIPGRNERLMDELQQNGVLRVNPQGRAIWKAKVSSESWPRSHTLTMLRIPVSNIWPELEARPAAFNGIITVEESNKNGEDNICTSEGSIDSNVYNQADGAKNKEGETQPKNRFEGDKASAAPEKPDKQEPSFSSKPSFEGLPLPLLPESFNRSNEKESDEQENREIEPLSNEPPENNTELNEDPGMAFLTWLRRGLRDKTLPINVVNARVHIVPEGVLLVSPGIFKDYDLARWSHVQKRFQKLKLNQKTANKGENIHVYLVDGPRRKSRQIKGFLITETDKVLAGITLPSPNPHLRSAAGDE